MIVTVSECITTIEQPIVIAIKLHAPFANSYNIMFAALNHREIDIRLCELIKVWV